MEVPQIRMVDLKGQYNKIKSQVDAAIQQVIDETSFIRGSAVKNFSKELADYLSCKYVVPCGNGTDALQVALMSLDLKPGDEVITGTFTFIATAEVIALLGLTPVLVDVDNDSFLMTKENIEKAITPKTKAIIPVHLFGQCAPMDEIMQLAEKYKLFVIEDNAQAIGADFKYSNGETKKSGTIGHIGCTSFFPSKNLGCYGDGGAIFTNNDELFEKMNMIVNHGMKKRYYHDIVGVNSRLDSIQAAVLSQKLPLLNDYCDARRKAADFYDNAFSEIEDIETPKRVDNSTHVFHQYTLKIKSGKRDALKEFLTENSIPCAVYYPVPLHLQKVYKDERYNEGDFVTSENLAKEVLSLPMHTELSEEQLIHITNTVKRFFQ